VIDDAIVVGGGIAGPIAARDVASEFTGWPAPVVSGRAAAREALGRLA
jgi:heterodisulfide reductase subunit A-like polyferredoxin